MKYCPRCGRQCGDNYIYCDLCGFAFNGAYTSGRSYYRASPAAIPQRQYNYRNVHNSDYESLSILAFIIGLFSIPLSFCCGVGTITGIVSIVLGGILLSKVNSKTVSKLTCIFGISSLVFGIVSVMLSIIYWIFVIGYIRYFLNNLSALGTYKLF